MFARLFFASILSTLLGSPTLYAATIPFDIVVGGNNGSFLAPDTGGVISNFTVTLSGITFDAPDLSQGPNFEPIYDPLENDINGQANLFAYFTNTTAGPMCPISKCVLEFEDSDMGMPPKLYSVFNIDVLTVFDSGEYKITPSSDMSVVPIPAAAWLFATGLISLVGFSKRKAIRPKKR